MTIAPRTILHGSLASGRWSQLSFVEQMANVGSDVERAFVRALDAVRGAGAQPAMTPDGGGEG